MTIEPFPEHSSGPHELLKKGLTRSVTLLFAVILLVVFPATAAAKSSVKAYGLDQAIAVALENNRLRTISQQSLQIAEAQYQQAKSTYWPSLSLNASFQRRDENANFEYPAQRFDLMPGVLPPVEVPVQEIDILGRDTTLYSLDMNYPLYTGGKRSSLIEQARLGVDIAAQEVRRTDLQVVQDVKRYFYAAHYTQQLADLAEEISIAFEVLRDITQAFYDGGSNSVNKLDLLQSKLAYTLASATQAELASKHASALAALAFAMGLDWRAEIRLNNPDYAVTIPVDDLENLVEQALDFNPQAQQLKLAVDVYEAKIEEASSDHYPMVGLMASVGGFDNDLDGGLDTDANRSSWTLGIGVKMKLFEGGLTQHRVSAARVGRDQKEQQRLLLNESLATQIKHLFLQTYAAKQQIEITQTAVETARENRDLSSRAYQTGAVKTEKVIEANLMDALVRANHYRAKHDQALHLAEITYLLGKEVTE